MIAKLPTNQATILLIHEFNQPKCTELLLSCPIRPYFQNGPHITNIWYKLNCAIIYNVQKEITIIVPFQGQTNTYNSLHPIVKVNLIDNMRRHVYSSGTE